MKHWLVIYDVRDPRRLAKIAREMTHFGIRVQQSVFEIQAPEGLVRVLRKRVQKLMADEDYVVYFDICERDWQKREKYGRQQFDDSQEGTFQIY